MRQASDNLVRHVAKRTSVIDILKDDLEFVATQATDFLAVSDDLYQPLSHLLQQRIAGWMPQRVIHLLEPVEIDEHDRASAFLHLKRRKCRFQQFRHTKAVEQAGQRVIGGEPRCVFCRSALNCNVGSAAAKTGKRLAGVEKWPPRYRPPNFVVIPRSGCLQGQIVEF